MISRRAVAVMFAAQMLAAVAFAQENPEFGRASGGELDLFTKHSQKLSGSLSLSLSNSLGFGAGHGYGATAGGTIIPDRLWFFGSAEQQTPMRLGQQPSRIATNMQTTLNDRHDLAAFFNETGRSALQTSAAGAFSTLPSSFLSLHYTGIVSPSSFFSVSVSRSSTNPQQ